MANGFFNEEQKEWIRSQLFIYAPFELLPIINEKYGANLTAKQFKQWRSNNKVTGNVRKNPRTGLCSVFTPEIIEFIHANYMTMESPYMAKVINEKYGTTYTKGQIRAYRHNHKLYSNLIGAYNENRPNKHKGEKGWAVPNSEKNRYKKGSIPVNKEPLLTIKKRPGADGYLFIKIAEPNIWEFYHRYVWEQANGPLKEGEKIKFLDGNIENCTLENMMIIDNRVQGKCAGGKRYSANPEETKAGILISKIEIALEESND